MEADPPVLSVLRGGRYAVRRTLGEGTQAQTLEALDTKTQSLVAIKRFDVRGARQWKDVELAEREARVLASLSHDALPAYIEHFEEGGALFLVMEKIEGESLAARRRAGGTCSEADVVRFLGDASRVLAYLHEKSPPIIHRDIKPSNVIRRPDGSFAIVDFGAVRDRMKPEGGSTVVGTFGYMAPEQFQGRALPASDVYATGATALAMLTGKEPESLPHRGLRIDVAAALGGGVSPRLVRVLEALLEPDPDVRPAGLAPLVDELRAKIPESRKSRPQKPHRHGRKAGRVKIKRSRQGRMIYALVWMAYGLGWWKLWGVFGHSWLFVVFWSVLAVFVGRVAGALVNAVEREMAMMRAAGVRVDSGASADVRTRVLPDEAREEQHEAAHEEELDEPDDRAGRKRMRR